MIRAALSYALFVGLPLFALLGVLEAGERLRAPMAVHGHYALELEWMEGASDACLAGLFRRSTALEVAQSGRRVELRVSNAPELVLYGVIDTSSLAAVGRLSRAAVRRAPACLRGDTVRIEAEVLRDATGHTLTGRATRRICLACAPLGLTAVARDAEPEPGA
ncbi:MAG TPA: hypothetical protein VFX50_15995 [Gemmatimonadales bacterium]|nr:hypothetical protein [Gemmatimonadales bacterium]